ncbi:MAG: hypothetical protein KC731_31855, partial [Myxococcales bacterium]|nr:hypothetical protein [Myxococcales bacterium]
MSHPDRSDTPRPDTWPPVDDERITRPVNAPLCVAIEVPESSIFEWATAASELGLLLRHLGVAAAASLVPSWRPLAVLVTPAVLAAQGRVLRRLCASADAALVVVAPDADRATVRAAL